MPQISQSKKATATTIKSNKPFLDRLRDRYKYTDFVRVINVDNEDFEWQYFPVDGEETSFDDSGRTRQVYGRQSFVDGYSSKVPGNETTWLIKPGDSEVLPGRCADLFIEGLYKRLVAKNKIAERPNIEKTQSRSFNFADGLQQEQWIDKIFLGIEEPIFRNESARSTTTEKK